MSVKKEDFSLKSLCEEIGNEFCALYRSREREDECRSYVAIGDWYIEKNPLLINAIAKERGDYFTSDREIMALMITLEKHGFLNNKLSIEMNTLAEVEEYCKRSHVRPDIITVSGFMFRGIYRDGEVDYRSDVCLRFSVRGGYYNDSEENYAVYAENFPRDKMIGRESLPIKTDVPKSTVEMQDQEMILRHFPDEQRDGIVTLDICVSDDPDECPSFSYVTNSGAMLIKNKSGFMEFLECKECGVLSPVKNGGKKVCNACGSTRVQSIMVSQDATVTDFVKFGYPLKMAPKTGGHADNG